MTTLNRTAIVVMPGQPFLAGVGDGLSLWTLRV
jgi:hypothetical protein